MKRLFGLALVGFLFIGVFSAPAVAGGDNIRVMTRNEYLGADLTPVIEAARSLEDFIAAAEVALTQIAINNFPLRARRLATEVAFTRPDLIGLQEVYDFTVNGANIGPPFVDHLQETLDALSHKGQHYVVAATVEHLDITIPIDTDRNGTVEMVRVLDRDVILVREGVEHTALSGDFMTGGLCGVPLSLPGLPLLQSTLSQDGCNYTIAAEVNSTVPEIGDIIIERGFVGVDVTVRGKDYRIVDTHLEVREPDGTPSSRIVQFLQSVELVGTLQATTPLMSPDRKLILLGDFNSSPEDEPIGAITPPYQIIADAGFADIWNTNPLRLFDPNGFTCCQDADLGNTTSLLDERIDLIFVRDTSFRPLAFVTGRVPIFPLRRPPNWASDHGGVFGKLIFRRGAME